MIEWLRSVYSRPVAICMIFLFITGLGIFAFRNSPVSLMPKIDHPAISIRATFPGEAADRVENLITEPVEQALNGISGVQTIQSKSSRNQAEIDVEFDLDTDMQLKYLEIREQIKRLENDLPDGMDSLTVRQFSSEDVPALISAFTSPEMTPEQVRELLENELEPQLLRVEGVADVQIVGGRRERFIVDLDPYRLLAYDLDIVNVAGMIASANYIRPLAPINWQNRVVPLRQRRLPALEENIRNLAVERTEAGDLIRLSQLGSVERGFLEPSTISHVDGRPSVAAYVFKTSEANILEVSDKVRPLMDEFAENRLALFYVFDQADPIRESFDSLLLAVFLGGFTAVLVLYVFLRGFKVLLMIVSSIPLSVLMTVLFIYISPFTLNVVTLSGIALGVGMLLDSAIIVAEKVRTIYDKNGDLEQACAVATSQVVAPLIASVLTTIIVFMPLLFMDPQIKNMYMGFAFAVSIALISSLAIAFFLVPVLIKTFGVGITHKTERLNNLYMRLLLIIKEYRRFVLVAIPVLLILTVPVLLSMGEVLGTFFDDRSLSIQLEVAPGTPIDQSRRLINELERRVSDYNFVETFSTRFERWTGRMNVKLHSRIIYDIPLLEAADIIKDEISPLRDRGLQAYVQQQRGAGDESIRLEVSGPDVNDLYNYSRDIIERVEAIGHLENMRIVMPRPQPAVQINFNLEMLGRYGIHPERALNELRTKVGGQIATRVLDEGREYDVLFRLERSMIDSFQDLDYLTLTSADKEPINIQTLANFTAESVGSQIQRKDGNRTAFLVGDISGIDLGGLFERIKEVTADYHFPRDYFFSLGDQYEQLLEMRASMAWMIILTVVLIFLVLMGVLESLWKPLLIMVSVPLSLASSIWVLWFFGYDFSLAIYIGLVMLMGLVVNSAIILVALISEQHSQGVDLDAAVINGSVERLQPILMTTCTTVVAMTPLLLTDAAGATLSAPLAVTVMSGLFMGAMFNLLIIPVLYWTVESWKKTFIGLIKPGC